MRTQHLFCIDFSALVVRTPPFRLPKAQAFNILKLGASVVLSAYILNN
jgi:hypothetical protein